MRQTLYELSDAYRAILEGMYDASDDGGMIPPDLAEQLQAAEQDLSKKAEACCCVLAELETAAEAFKREENRIKLRRQQFEKQSEWMKNYIKGCLEAAHVEKLQAGTFKLSLQLNPPKVVIDDIDQIPAEYDVLPERQVAKDKIKESINAGTDVPGARLIQEKGLRIR